MKTVVITGGSRGIGAAAVEAFAARGDRVYFLYEKEHEAAKAVAESVEMLEGQMKGLHERMDMWEEHYEQEAALAAARIIREEIAAMRAGAARMQH